jgi:Cu/Ag efflux protein CusF
MRKSLISAALAASLVSTVAFAANQTDSGTIKTLDSVKHQLTLADGKIFALPAAWDGAGFKIGDKVKVTYEMQSGKMMANAVAHES